MAPPRAQQLHASRLFANMFLQPSSMVIPLCRHVLCMRNGTSEAPNPMLWGLVIEIKRPMCHRESPLACGAIVKVIGFYYTL